MNVYMFKMPFQTKHFRQNQKVWVQSTCGWPAALVTGRFRGKGRYVSAWVNWGKKPNPEFKEFEVDDSFAIKHGLCEVKK